MKVFDAQAYVDKDNAEYSKDKYYYHANGPWTDSVCWKELINDGYTHVTYDGKTFTLGKFGPNAEVTV